MNSKIVSSVSALALAAAMAAAQAAPVVYFGENQTPSGVVSGAPATARSSFLGNLTGVGNEGFEGFNFGAPPPLALSFAGSGSSPLAATLSGDGQIDDRTGVGRFNTTPGGSKWWDVSGAFTIDFTTPIAAFGFYGTDIGDFAGSVTILLTDTANQVTNLTVGNTVSGANGALLFWGFIDSTATYRSVTFGNTGTGIDGFGFDDMVIGDRGQVGPPSPIPEPSTFALFGLGLLGLAATRRRA